MAKDFSVHSEANKMKSIYRTIRIQADAFDKLMLLSEKTGVSMLIRNRNLRISLGLLPPGFVILLGNR